MNGKFDKKFIELVVKTANELSKHHADVSFQLVIDELDERFSNNGKTVDDLLDMLSGLDKTQSGFGEELKSLFDKLSESNIKLRTLIANSNGVSTENFTSIDDEITSVRDDLAKGVDDVSERVSKLAEVNLDAVTTNSNEFEKANVRIDKVDEAVNSVSEIVAGNKEEFVGDINLLADNVKGLSVGVAKAVEDTGGKFKSVDVAADVVTENVNLLAGSIKELNDRYSTSTKANTESVFELLETITKVGESVSNVVDDVNGKNKALSDRIVDVIKGIDNVVANFTEKVESSENIHATSLQNILTDIAKFDERVAILKSSLIGYGEDIATLSSDVHDQLETLSDKTVELSNSVRGVNFDISQVNDSVEKVTDITTGILETVDKSNKNIDESSRRIDVVVERVDATAVQINASNDRIKACDESISNIVDTVTSVANNLSTGLKDANSEKEELAERLISYSEDLVKLAESNSMMLEDVEKMTTMLSEQFSELKNESFLSADKIDTKFAEIKLSMVEADIRRRDFLKETIDKQCDIIQQDLDNSFKDYRRNIANRVEASNTLVAENVAKTLDTDKQMLARAKQWVPGVEYGQNVIARNIGGVWQAKELTTDEPTVESNSWVCLFSSYYRVTKLSDHQNGVETVIGLHDSLGNVQELTIPVATVRYLKGVYQDHVEYDHLDSIMKDGCRWVATKDNPQGVPGDDKSDWQVLTMRGPKGMKGSTGERGSKGATGDCGEKGSSGETGARGESSTSSYLYTRDMLSPTITRVELDNLIKTPTDGQITIIHSDIGIERYFRCEYIGEVDKWIVTLVNAV